MAYRKLIMPPFVRPSVIKRMSKIMMELPIEKKEIAEFLNERDKIYKKRKLSPSDHERAGDIKTKIITSIRKNFDEYEVDFIIETWTRFGSAPNIMYDDNGLFAVAEDGFQPVVSGNEKIEGSLTVFVKKEQWKKTIREALAHYIKPLKKYEVKHKKKL